MLVWFATAGLGWYAIYLAASYVVSLAEAVAVATP